jgi:hypothetical protein
MAKRLEDKLAALPADWRARVAARAAGLVAEETNRRVSRPMPASPWALTRRRGAGQRPWRAAMLVRRSGRTLAALVTPLALAACSSVEEAMIERGLPPAYARGYDDGCASGKENAGGFFAEARKDASRYGADDQYRQGWDDGFAKCRRDTAVMVRDARLRHPSGED